MRSSGNPRGREFLAIHPSLLAQDGSEISVVRFVALVEADCAMVGIEPYPSRQNRSIFQIPEHRGVEWRRPLDSLKGSGKTYRRAEEIRAIKEGPDRHDSRMSRPHNPTGRRVFKKRRSLGDFRQQGCGIGNSRTLRNESRDHLGENPFRMQWGGPLRGMQSSVEHQQQGMPPHASLVGKRHAHRRSIDFNQLFHTSAVADPASFTNPS